MSVTISDVARRARVSSATVSRVLAGKPHVSDDLRQRVLTAVKELGYKPSRVARSLRVQRSNIIGLIISDIQNPFFTSLVRAVEDMAYDHDYAVLLCNSDENIEKEALYIELLLAEQVSGVVITPTRETNNPSRRLIAAGTPVVAVDRRMHDLDVDTVVVENIGSSYELTSHLLGHGYRRIGAITGPATSTTGRERLQGYTQALEAAGVESVQDLIEMGLPKEDFGYRAMATMLDLSRPPEAIFTANNLLTVGALRAVYERSLQIPDDIAVAAFDEMNWTSLVTPGLTTVVQPTYELGCKAAQLLLRRIEGDNGPVQKIVLTPTLCIRGSCGQH
jgi:DNA-binding LacI/PurR family transcriptional regulator